MKLAALLFLVFAQAAAASPATDEQAIREIEHELAEGSRRNDASAWDRHASRSLVFTNPGGQVHDFAAATAGIRAGYLKFESLELGEIRVVVHGDTAVASFDTRQKATSRGRDHGGHIQWTDTFVRQDGRWMLVARHGSMRR